jgi:predicted nuclease of restriction endonuclease-like (RecB) superfamily
MPITMARVVPSSALPPADLHGELRLLIASSRQRLAGAVNAELTRLYWAVGDRLRAAVLAGEARARYGERLVDQIGARLSEEFGRGFEAKNLRRMMQLAEVFPQAEIVATLSRQLSWSHLLCLLPLPAAAARDFYAGRAAIEGWSVRTLRQQIERKAFERTELAATQSAPAADASLTAGGSANVVFKDPYFLDFLGLSQGHDEADLEDAILRQLESFILELGRGFAFVERRNLSHPLRAARAPSRGQRQRPGRAGSAAFAGLESEQCLSSALSPAVA